jgi:hypothetical protein
MQTVLNHMDAVVRPALRKYLEAGNGLTSTPQSKEARQLLLPNFDPRCFCKRYSHYHPVAKSGAATRKT